MAWRRPQAGELKQGEQRHREGLRDDERHAQHGGGDASGGQQGEAGDNPERVGDDDIEQEKARRTPAAGNNQQQRDERHQDRSGPEHQRPRQAEKRLEQSRSQKQQQGCRTADGCVGEKDLRRKGEMASGMSKLLGHGLSFPPDRSSDVAGCAGLRLLAITREVMETLIAMR